VAAEKEGSDAGPALRAFFTFENQIFRDSRETSKSTRPTIATIIPTTVQANQEGMIGLRYPIKPTQKKIMPAASKTIPVTATAIALKTCLILSFT